MKTNNKGFEIALNIQKKFLRVRAWGDWDVEFGKKYNMALRDKIMELSAHAHWKIWYVLMDLTRLSTQSEEVQSMISQALVAVSKQGMKKVACLGDKSHSLLLLKRVSGENNGQTCAFFESKDEALHWLLN